MDLILCRKRNKSLRDEPIKLHPELVLDDPSRSQAKNSGFVTLQERIKNLSERQASVESPGSDTEPKSPPGFNKHQQYATLQELFAGKSIMDGASDNELPKKPKIPVMKLSKEDWNVKCWENRFASGGKGLSGAGPVEDLKGDNSKPVRRIEVFQERIEDVASKLEKVKDGLPLDEDLYKLNVSGKRGQVKGSHEWTDMLKQELESGTHNPNLLRKGDPSASGALSTDRKSPLNRPIRKIFEDDDDGEDEANENEAQGRQHKHHQ